MSETMKDLVKRDGLWFKKFTEVPFTGKITGKTQGSFKNGKKEGNWVSYHDNGQLLEKGNYKNGKQEGIWILYNTNGEPILKKNYENGKLEGDHVSYWQTGQIWFKGNYKNGKREGYWVQNNPDGTVDNENTGTFKNGKKISD